VTAIVSRLALALALLASACGARPDTPTGCQRDDQCASGMACAGDLCIPRAAPSGTWAVELLPRSDSAAAVTEFSSITLDAGPLQLAARAKVMISGTLGPGSNLSSGAHVVVNLAAEIPGRADLQFEGEWPAKIDGGPAAFLLTVPDSVLGKTATMRVLPTPPDDRKQAPISMQVLLDRNGRLLSAIGDAESGFVARAFQGSQLISTVFETQADGAFSLAIPGGNIATDKRPIFVELAPKDEKAPKPRFRSREFSLPMSVELGELRLPAYSQPNVFRFDVRGENENGPPVSEAIVRARTDIEENATGQAAYLRDGRTDAQGVTDISLLPGSANALRPYDITVIPPPSSRYGVKCLSRFPLATGGTVAGPALAKKIALPLKPVLSGVILRADGVPAGGVTIMATRTEVDPAALCADAAASPPANVTTDSKTGAYKLQLDPGTYRIDYDPPAGAPVPRLTEAGVVVTGDVARTVQMQPAALIEGSIFAPDGTGLPSVTVRLLEIVCGGSIPCSGVGRVEPVLRGQARTDSAGTFRLVIPLMTR